MPEVASWFQVYKGCTLIETFFRAPPLGGVASPACVLMWHDAAEILCGWIFDCATAKSEAPNGSCACPSWVWAECVVPLLTWQLLKWQGVLEGDAEGDRPLARRQRVAAAQLLRLLRAIARPGDSCECFLSSVSSMKVLVNRMDTAPLLKTAPLVTCRCASSLHAWCHGI